MTPNTGYKPRWEAWPKNDRLGRWCVVDAACPGRGKVVIADNIRTEGNARLIAASLLLLQVAVAVETAYANGSASTFHTRLNELAEGDFARLLDEALTQASVAA